MGTFEFVDMRLDMAGIREVDRVCVEIGKLVEKVDFLCVGMLEEFLLFFVFYRGPFLFWVRDLMRE